MDRIRGFVLTVFIAAVILVSAVGAQEEQWLNYRSAREGAEMPGDVRLVEVALSEEAPKGIELPRFENEGPLFGAWATPMVENGRLWIAVDRTHKGGLCDRLLIDSNGDGRLADETALQAYKQDQHRTYFGPVKVIFQVEDGPVVYHLNFQFYRSGSIKRLYACSGGWYEGEITVGETKKQCVLIDHNVNGAFNDKSIGPGDCDRLLVGGNAPQDLRFVGRFVEIDGVLYRQRIAKDGACLTLTRAEDVKFGRVRAPGGITQFSAGGENGSFLRVPEDGIASLPVGLYCVNHWDIERRDGQGLVWRMNGSFSARGTMFDVREGAESELAIGEPIVATLNASGDKGQYSFRQGLKGNYGETIALTRNGSRPPPPKLRIRNKDGTYDQTRSFEYG
ncbi:MAG: hypothetical protein IH624_12710 [Phycisphaerae bacterium]|nr:hypothetical protein [Phycisphaerae bacterium]